MSDVKGLSGQGVEAAPATPPAGRTAPNGGRSPRINPLTAQPLDPSQSVQPETARRPLPPPAIAALVMLGAAAELLLYAAAGLVAWAAVNAAAGTAVGVVWLSRRRQAARRRDQAARRTVGPDGRSRPGERPGRPGLADRLSRFASGRAGGNGQRGGSPASGRGGLLSRLTGAGRAGSSSTGSPGHGGLLSRLTGGGGRAGSPGSSGGGHGGLMSRLTGGRGAPAGRGGSPAAGHGGLLSRLAGLGAGGASRSGSSPGGRPTFRPTATPRGGSPAGGGGRPAGRPKPGGSGAWQQFGAGLRVGAEAADKAAASWGDRKDPAEKPKDLADKKSAETRPAPTKGAGPTKEKKNVGIRYSEDSSLQAWGRNLQTISPALEEAGSGAAEQAELAGALASSMRKLATQGETDLPADRRLVAEAETIGHDLAEIEQQMEASAAKLRQLAGRSEELSRGYFREHETDEGRLNGERGGRHKERRADVTSAELDV